jgi:hypothetical protein
MPVTPFHMGPGLAIKAVLGRHLSLMVFGFSQVAMDVEPLVRIMRGDAVLHGFTHTYAGATLIALGSVVIGRRVCQFLLDHWRPDPRSRWLDSLRDPRPISRIAAIAGGFVGAYSHVLFDSMMHADMEPFAPWSGTNALLHVVSVGGLHLAGLLAGGLGALLMLALVLVRRGAGVNRPA